ncbi:MAG: YbhB/YbcL family Raf kinase inhibitor-like protein [Conexivisphaera sp.]|jgi:Raf kinase inhibitor-like YbhB/YbcL family protein|nr:YbhB/YbcL family Raf kinase inhibitor-like protein [Conexivisphaerales archaeon]
MPRRRSSWRKWALLAIAVVILMGFVTPYMLGAISQGPGYKLIPEGVPTFSVWSPAFAAGGTIPVNFTCSGADVSPPINWSGQPNGTMYYALIMVDLNSSPPGFVQWMLYNVPGNLTGIPGGIPPLGTVIGIGEQGLNGYGGVGYAGPCTQNGQVHEYELVVYALGGQLNVPPGANEQEVLGSMAGLVKGVAVMRFYGS